MYASCPQHSRKRPSQPSNTITMVFHRMLSCQETLVFFVFFNWSSILDFDFGIWVDPLKPSARNSHCEYFFMVFYLLQFSHPDILFSGAPTVASTAAYCHPDGLNIRTHVTSVMYLQLFCCCWCLYIPLYVYLKTSHAFYVEQSAGHHTLMHTRISILDVICFI